MLTIENLKMYGADVDDGLQRCMNNKDFYLRLVKMALQDGSFVDLGNALNQKQYDTAFDHAHKLKGVLANLSLTPILEPVSELTELLRHKTDGDYDGLYTRMMEEYEKLKAL
jgi:HPt (histidine-containing phosphotransfer) domain-containing protein